MQQSMSQPLHHSFILRPANTVGNSAATMTNGFDTTTMRRQVIPPDRPHLTLLRNKTLTSPPRWSRRRCPKPTQLFSDSATNTSRSQPRNDLRAEFEPPTSPTYWKERCLRFQDLCQSSRKRLREMEEDQRQLRKRIYQLEKRLTSSYSFNPPSSKKIRSVTPSPGEEKGSVVASDSGIPTMIVAHTNKWECFYMADCEGMSDSEYGEHYCAYEDEEDDEEEDNEQEATKQEKPCAVEEKRDDEE